jgi:hypothetical protein
MILLVRNQIIGYPELASRRHALRIPALPEKI